MTIQLALTKIVKQGVHFCNYSGIALEHSGWGMNRFNTSGRIVVDARTFHRLNPDTSFEVARFGDDTAHAKRKRAQRPRHPDEYDYDDLDLPVNNGQDVEDEESRQGNTGYVT